MIYSEITEDVTQPVVESLECTAMCCLESRDEPYHQISDFTSSKKKQGSQIRTFQKSWLKTHPWLSYCTTRNVVFCFYCRNAKRNGRLTFSKNTDGAFTVTGYSNWKKAKQSFKKHEKSLCHREAFMKFNASKAPSVIEVANTALLKTQEIRRSMLLKQLSCLKFLLRQGLAIRGHLNMEGNLYQLMKCRSEDIPNFNRWIEDGKYQSLEIENEIIELMAKSLVRQLIQEIKSAEYFSLIVDETRDISGKEQLALSVRWVNGSYEIFEDLIGLIEVEKTDAVSLVSTIKGALTSVGLSLSSCCGQAYDGAANMAGTLNGVAIKIKREEPKALFVHS